MTKLEHKLTADRLLARFAANGHRREHITHGHSEHFGDGSNRTTMKLDTDPGSGWVAREGNGDQDPDLWRDDLTNAISYIQKAIAKTANDGGLTDALATLLSTADVLARVPDGALIRRGKVNKTGNTREPLNINSNEVSRTAGIHTIDIAEWGKECPAVLRLAQKYPEVFAANL